MTKLSYFISKIGFKIDFKRNASIQSWIKNVVFSPQKILHFRCLIFQYFSPLYGPDRVCIVNVTVTKVNGVKENLRTRYHVPT